MTDLFLQSAIHARAWLLLAGSLWMTLPAGAQSPSPTGQVERFDPKAATKLLKKQATPEYPSVAKFNFIQGSVRMQVKVNPQGKVSEAHVVEGHPILAASALRAVRRWLFRPFLTKDGPTAFLTWVDVTFSLHSKKLFPMPSHPEEYLDRQVKPPEVLDRPAAPDGSAFVRLRLLVGDEGRVIDSRPLEGEFIHIEAAREVVGCWTFEPARWGAVRIPWYLDVDVPVEGWVASRRTAGLRQGCP